MSTAATIAIIAVVVIVLAVIVALVVRSKKQRQQSTRMRLPELGALSTDGLDKSHASAPHADRNPTEPAATPPTTGQTRPQG
jgi:hypothetical protein